MDDLQFERAEFGAAPPARNCTGCHQPIAGHYFDVNGQPFCEACTASIRQAHGDSPGGAAFGRALGAGLVAGAVGSSLYYLVAKISGYQLVDHRHRASASWSGAACGGPRAGAAA